MNSNRSTAITINIFVAVLYFILLELFSVFSWVFLNALLTSQVGHTELRIHKGRERKQCIS
jgi:hypothetical protein